MRDEIKWEMWPLANLKDNYFRVCILFNPAS